MNIFGRRYKVNTNWSMNQQRKGIQSPTVVLVPEHISPVPETQVKSEEDMGMNVNIIDLEPVDDMDIPQQNQ